MDISVRPSRHIRRHFVMTDSCVERVKIPSRILFFISHIFLDRTQITFDFLLYNLGYLVKNFCVNFGFRFCMVSVLKKKKTHISAELKEKKAREHSVEVTKRGKKERHCSWVHCARTIDQCALLLQGKMSVTSNITHV